MPFLPDIVLIAFGDHQIPLIVGAHIQTGNDPLGQGGLPGNLQGHDRFGGSFEKILQHTQAGPAAFFRMKLSCDDVAFLNAADKLAAIVGGGQDNFGIIGDHVIRMDKIKFLIALQSVKNPGRFFIV